MISGPKEADSQRVWLPGHFRFWRMGNATARLESRASGTISPSSSQPSWVFQTGGEWTSWFLGPLPPCPGTPKVLTAHYGAKATCQQLSQVSSFKAHSMPISQMRTPRLRLAGHGAGPGGHSCHGSQHGGIQCGEGGQLTLQPAGPGCHWHPPLPRSGHGFGSPEP